MKTVGLSILAVLSFAAMALAGSVPARAEDTLRLCLDKKASSALRPGSEADGFDLGVAQAVARRLGRAVSVQWFETETDRDNNPAAQVNALLSDGRCQLVGGLPLFASAIGDPPSERSRLPQFDGARSEDRRRWVQLRKLVASRGYRFDPLVVVLGPGMDRGTIGSLRDLTLARIGAEEGTLADAILMMYDGGLLISRIEHIAPGRGLLDRMEQGNYNATLVELHRFDEHRALHPDTKLSSSGHFHSIGFNIGFVGLASDAPMMVEVNAAIGEMLAQNQFPAIAHAAGLTYLPPRAPDVLTAIPSAALRGD